MRKTETATVVSNREAAEKTFITKFYSPKVAPLVKPGQFVMVSFPDSYVPLLARAFSVSDVHGGNLSLLYTAIGKGTTRLSKLGKGATIMINGPLGKGFPDFAHGEKVWIVLGGSGAALIPILYKSAKRSAATLKIFYGARTKRQVVTFKNIKAHHATEDGSIGYHGTVLGLLGEHLKKEKPDKIFACGPTAMLAALQLNMNNRDIPIFFSVETPMACGMGFCQGCPVKIKDASDYFLACKDGPVFDGRKIELE
jgi:dihydroorotate dehydrogenase electron transfer subunit